MSGLENMIDGGRLSEGDIPNDYDWLVQTINAIRRAEYRSRGQSSEQSEALLREAVTAWEDHGDSTEYNAVMRKVMYYLDATPHGLKKDSRLPIKINAMYALMQIYSSWAQCGDSEYHDDAMVDYPRLAGVVVE